MRLMTRTLTLLFLVLPASLSAQNVVPRLYLAPDLVIDAKQIKGAGGGSIGTLSVGPDGRMMVTPKNGLGEIYAFDAGGKSLNWHIPVGDRNGEIGWINRVGLVGNALWLSDYGYGQVVLIDVKGHVSRATENPSWLHPRWAERRKYPLFAAMDAMALYPNSSMLVLPLRPRSVLDTPEFDRSLIHLLRIDAGGAIQRTVVMYDLDEGRGVTFKVDGRYQHTMPVPFFARTYHIISADGRRIAIVTPGTTEADSGTFLVTMLDENGATVFRRRYPQPAVRVNKASVDSVLSQTRGIFGIPAEQVRSKLATRVPTFRSFLTDAYVGIDHSTWIVLRPVLDSARARDALVLDDRGEPLATVRMPDGITPMVVDRAHLWGADRAKNALVRLKLQPTPAPVVTPTPAPPTRIEKAATRKVPAHR
jgi:hypothetical protein